MPNIDILTPAELRQALRQTVSELSAEYLLGRAELPSPRKTWLSAGDACSYLGISRSTLHRLRSQGAVPTHKIGRSIRFKPDELDAVVAR